MPLPTRAAQVLSNAQKIKQLEHERTRFENRYQDLAAKFYYAQADYLHRTRQHEACQQVVQAKQEVIHVLLPYYPHPLTPELRAKINLGC